MLLLVNIVELVPCCLDLSFDLKLSYVLICPRMAFFILFLGIDMLSKYIRTILLLSYVYFYILARTLELNSSARLNDLVGSLVNETIKNLGTLLLLG